jgi:hypothetical protein
MADELLRRFGHLNPVPDPDRLVALGGPDWPADPVLRAILAGESTDGGGGRAPTDGLSERRHRPEESPMPTLKPAHHDDRSPEGPDRRRRWTASAAAGVVALVAVAGLFAILIRSAPTSEVAEPTAVDRSDPVAVAEAYLAARDRYDARAALALLADEVEVDKASFPDVDELEPAFRVLELYGFRISPFACADPAGTGASGDAVLVECQYFMDSRLQHAVDEPPIEATFRFTVADGRITSMDDGFPNARYAPVVWRPFLRWLSEQPGAYGEIIHLVDGQTYLRSDPEALEAAARYLDEYEAWSEAQEE